MQPIDECRFSLREDRHLVAKRGKELIILGSPRKGEIFASSLLQFGVENVCIAVKDIDEMFLDLRKQVDPLQSVSRATSACRVRTLM